MLERLIEMVEGRNEELPTNCDNKCNMQIMYADGEGKDK